jgi:hypothetical protein
MFNQSGMKSGSAVQSASQPREAAPSKKVTHVSEAKFYAVRYGDDRGEAHTAVLMRIGGKWYMPPNAEQWSLAVKPLAPWLEKQLGDHVSALAAPATKEDTVDVLSAEGSK